MSKIRKTTCFKFTALIMAFLFIFQADVLLPVKNTTDYEKQYEMAEKEFHQRQYQSAKVRLLRLINVLNKKDKQEKQLLKKANALLERIRKPSQVIEVKKKNNGKKRKKFPWLLAVLGVAAVGTAVYFLLIKKSKESKITNVEIKFKVRFAGTNLNAIHKVIVDGSTHINKSFAFDVPSSDQWSNAKKYYETFYVNRGLGDMEIRQIADSSYSSYYSGNCWIWATSYELEVTDYTYTGKTDPGKPILSEDSFYLKVVPWISDDPDWDRDQSKTITISVPPDSSTSISRTRGKNNVSLESENTRICSDRKR